MTSQADESSEQPAAVRYYRVDSRRLTCAELWRLAHHWLAFLVLVVIKVFRIRGILAAGIPVPNDVIRLDPDQLPPRAAEALRPGVAEWEHHGLRLAFYWTSAAEPLADEEMYAATLLSEDGVIAATTVYNRVTVGEFTQEHVSSGATTKMPDGVVLTTTTRKRDYDDAPHRRVHYLTGRTVTAVAAHHRHRLGNIPLEPDRFTPSALLDFFQQEGRRQTQAFIDRGVLVPMTAEEVEAARRRLRRAGGGVAMPQAAGRADSEHADQSPAAPAATAKPVGDPPRPLARPLAFVWLMWPPVVVLVFAHFMGEVPLSAFFLLIVLANNAGFVDCLYRRNLVRRGWLLFLIWVLILIGQMAALVAALLLARAFSWIMGDTPPLQALAAARRM